MERLNDDKKYCILFLLSSILYCRCRFVLCALVFFVLCIDSNMSVWTIGNILFECDLQFPAQKYTTLLAHF